MGKKVTLILFLSTGSTWSVNGQVIVTDRPDQTESSTTIPAGTMQIESGAVFENTQDNSILNNNLIAPTTLFRVGIIDGVELRVLNQFESLKIKDVQSTTRHSGFSDLEIGTKIRLFSKDNINTEIAVLSHLVIPTGDRKITIGDYGSISKLSISHTISENISVGYNVGYDYLADGDGNATYSLAFGITVTDKLALFAEPFGEIVEFDEHVGNFDAGFTYLLKDNLQLDYSFGIGLTHDMNYFSAGVSWNIARK